MRRPYSPLTPEQKQQWSGQVLGNEVTPAALQKAGVYIHIPFCSSRCRYCDFYFETGWSPRVMHRTLDRIVQEAAYFMKHSGYPEIKTLYIGGGTPSVIPPQQLSVFLQSLSTIFNMRNSPPLEWSFEANPENIDRELLAILAEQGVTRLSIGVQTFCDDLLRILTRRAYSNTVNSALQLVHTDWVSPQRSFSIDLISGIPGQTPQHITHDIENAERFAPHHISHYTLTIEPQTPLSDLIRRRELFLPDQDELWEQLNNGLGRLGFEQYEVSNYARNQQYSLHNQAYWRMYPYIGLGPGAVGTIPLTSHQNAVFPARLTNPDLFRYSAPSTKTWLHEIEPLNAVDMFTDYCITGLRTKWGMNLHDLHEVFGSTVDTILDLFINPQKQLFIRNKNSICCTEQGRLLLNQVIKTGLESIERNDGWALLRNANLSWPTQGSFTFPVNP